MDFEVRLVSATGHSSSHGWHQGARGATLPEQLERLALIGMTRNEQLSTGWVDESQHGGMLLAVLGHLGDADRDLLAGLAAAGDSAYAVVLDVATWDRGRPATSPRHRCAAQRRLEGDHPRPRRVAGRLLAGAGPMTSTAGSPTRRRPDSTGCGRRPGPPLLALLRRLGGAVRVERDGGQPSALPGADAARRCG